jgi:hypothetical protein
MDVLILAFILYVAAVIRYGDHRTWKDRWEAHILG